MTSEKVRSQQLLYKENNPDGKKHIIYKRYS